MPEQNPAPSARRRTRRTLTALATYGALVVVLASCVSRPPRGGSVDAVSRLDPLDGPWPGLVGEAEIAWDERLIPSIRAETDRDGAYALGLVHAHLRLSQMEFIRRVSQGRLSEMAGPLTVGIDEGIRAIDLDRAVPEMISRMPAETREWIEGYVAGINDYRESSAQATADARTLGFDYDEPWTIEDVLTLGRLASVDVNWGRWLTLIPLEGEEGAEEFVQRLWSFAEEGEASFGGGNRTDLSVLFDIGRTGSNAIVVSGDRSASGGALVATDPHLGLPQPNIWCIVGIRTPSMNAVGLTVPGLPFVLLGRNERVAWSGTNMQSTSSVLYRLPEGWTPTGEREEDIRVRAWFDAKKTIRESALGPVLTDAKLLKRLGEGDLAFKWRGHQPSDEASAFFGASKASTWDEFRNAFSTYAVSGQNMLYADAAGNIGQVMALEAIPAAGRASRTGPVPTDDPEFAWTPGIPSDRLPAAFNPAEGFLVSANNVPTLTDPVLVPQGNANDRIRRMRDLIGDSGEVTLDDLAVVQRDTYSEASHRAARAIVEKSRAAGVVGRPLALADALDAWDGRYDADSSGALAYQHTLRALLNGLYDYRYSRRVVGVLRQGAYVHDFVREDVEAAAAHAIGAILTGAARDWDPDAVWGDVHRLRVSHPIGSVPFIGSSYVFRDLPYSGSSSTILKAAHPVTSDRHSTSFGANARLLFDMGTLDDNRVVLLGGQDGWIGSDRFIDQIDLWQRGESIPLPLSAEAQDARAVRRTTLSPGGGP